MKIFWSWQSDTPGNIGRHFIRSVLDDALKELMVESDDFDEATREDTHIDQDRQGAAGSPDLVKTILEKIRLSSVFVADVTPVGRNDDKKKYINPNVAIELGYALAHVGDEGLLMVMNEAYGNRESLPFDLRHKAGPIIFNLPQNSTNEQKIKARKLLKKTLKTALNECLKAKQEQEQPNSNDHSEIPITNSCAIYFRPGEVLDKRISYGSPDTLIRYLWDSLLYLRVIPTKKLTDLRQAELKSLVNHCQITPLNDRTYSGFCWSRNKYGGMTYSYGQENGKLTFLSSTQIFSNREIWGIDSITLNDTDEKIISSYKYEEILKDSLYKYVGFGIKNLQYDFPLIIEAGAANVENYSMAMDSNNCWGPILKKNIQSRHSLKNFESDTVDNLLLNIFEDFFDETGTARPINYRGFPNS